MCQLLGLLIHSSLRCGQHAKAGWLRQRSARPFELRSLTAWNSALVASETWGAGAFSICILLHAARQLGASPELALLVFAAAARAARAALAQQAVC